MPTGLSAALGSKVRRRPPGASVSTEGGSKGAGSCSPQDQRRVGGPLTARPLFSRMERDNGCVTAALHERRSAVGAGCALRTPGPRPQRAFTARRWKRSHPCEAVGKTTQSTGTSMCRGTPLCRACEQPPTGGTAPAHQRCRSGSVPPVGARRGFGRFSRQPHAIAIVRLRTPRHDSLAKRGRFIWLVRTNPEFSQHLRSRV